MNTNTNKYAEQCESTRQTYYRCKKFALKVIWIPAFHIKKLTKSQLNSY